MIWKSYVSTASTPDEVAKELAAQISGSPDFATMFVTPHFIRQVPFLTNELRKINPDMQLVAANGAGVVGDNREVERQPAVALVTAELPGVTVEITHVTSAELPTDMLERATAIMLLCDVFTSPTDQLLEQIDAVAPEAAVFGGLVSGGLYPGSNVLFDGHSVQQNGAIVVAFSGNIECATIVAQGSTPISNTFKATRVSQRTILELDGQRPSEVLAETLKDLDSALPESGVFVGLGTEDDSLHPSEFLVRTLMGVDPNGGAIHLNGIVQQDQCVQFQIRDKETSAEDIEESMMLFQETHWEPAGGLIFTCVGRGEGLYGHPNVDTGFATRLLNVPIGGFFCNGEIGRVRGQSYAFGYTSSFAFFRPKK